MKKILLFAGLGIAFISSTAFVLSSNGIIGKTGSPGEANCGSCHSGGAGVTTISVNATPALTNNQYIPGQLYTLTITIANASLNKYGFDCEILTSTNANAGAMSGAGTGVQFANSGSKKNATHTAPKTGTGSADFVFDWTAPASGNAIIYIAGNAVNGNNNDLGDRPAATSIVLTDITTNLKEQTASEISFGVYPNPAANEINTQYNLTSSSAVRISLNDLGGKEVVTVIEEQQDPGLHNITKQLPAELPSGVYMIKFSVNNKPVKQHMFIKR